MIIARVNTKDLDVLDKKIQAFACQYRKMYKSVPVKVHMLEDHVIPQMKFFMVRLGVLSEQGGENSHKYIKKLIKNYS